MMYKAIVNRVSEDSDILIAESKSNLFFIPLDKVKGKIIVGRRVRVNTSIDIDGKEIISTATVLPPLIGWNGWSIFTNR